MPSQSRQLAAIMFTDIAGYTALMGEDEQKAFELLKKNRAVQRPIIEKFNGKWLKEIGDGVLASFPTVTDAVYCAATIQKTCEDDPNLKLRIGIHQGEVVFEENDVFGDGVNIAARLEPLAPIGGILVSESVNRNLGNKQGIETNFVREEQLKNVKEPIKIYSVQVKGVEPVVVSELPDTLREASLKTNKPKKVAFAVTGVIIILLLSYFLYSKFSEENALAETQAVSLDKSIVVLPFTNLSSDPEQEYFSDGMMEEILNHLVKIEDLKVISRTTAMQYKGTTKSVHEITEELNVATALEGSVRKDGDQLRITVQLIEGDTDTHLWSESYDRQLTNIFEVQSDVAQLIAQVLQAEVSPEVKLQIESQPTIALDAYDYYLKGNEAYWSSWAKNEINKVHESIGYYEKAINLDDQFSLGYTGLGRSYWRLAGFPNAGLDRQSLWNMSKKYLEKAIHIDRYNGWAYGELIVVASNWLWDSTATRNYMEMALKLSPNDANVYIHSFWHEFRFANCGELQSIHRRLQDISPWGKRPHSYLNLALLLCQKDYKQIISIAQKLNLTEDVSVGPAWLIFLAYLYQNQLKEAKEALNSVNRNLDVKSFRYVNNAFFAAANNEATMLNQALDSLSLISNEEDVFYTQYAVISAIRGDREAMYDYLDTALNVREPHLHGISFYPWFNSYIDEPRFKEILGKMWVPIGVNE